ncbi:spindle and kinetochore-associated protein 2 [Arapaima gigas]
METVVNKLEATFQKVEADLEYIEKQLKFECISNIPENGSEAENPVKLLEQLNTLKTRHKAIHSQLGEIAALQKASVDEIRTHLNATVKLLQELQQTADFLVPPLTEKEQEAAESLCLPVSQHTEEVRLTIYSHLERKFKELSEAELETVPCSVCSNVKLTDLNMFYKQLFEHFVTRNNSGTLSLPQMKKMNMKVSDAKLKTLKHLSKIEIDKKGNVRLVARD